LYAFLTETLARIIFQLGYVSGTNSFPQPLTPEEEQKYIEAYREGSEDARNILIERNLRLVAHIVKKYSSFSSDSDDLISIGTIGLIKAISTFDQSKGTRLATYAARCIENEILMQIRSTKKIQSEVSLHDPIGIDREGNEITLIDVIGNETESVIDEVELKIQVKRLYNKMKSVLKKREKTVLELRYGLLNGTGKTQREIAGMLGISRSYVSRIEKKAIRKLSKELEPESGH
jgi:RNA polymerase sporulation-specific sigma factor